MSLPERELGIEDVVSWSLKYYKDNFVFLFAAFLAASIPLMVVEITVLGPMLVQFNSYLSQYVNVAYTDMPQPDMSQFPLLILGFVAYGLLLLFANCVTIIPVSNKIRSVESNPRMLLSEASTRFGKLLIASIALGAGMGVIVLIPFLISIFLFSMGAGGAILGGLIILVVIIGVIYLSIRLSLYDQVVLLEDLGIVDSGKRSFYLLKGRVLKMIVLGICVWLIMVIPSTIMGQITSGIGTDLFFISIILSAIASALSAPFQPIALTVYYHSLRSEVERPPPPAPPAIINDSAGPPPPPF